MSAQERSRYLPKALIDAAFGALEANSIAELLPRIQRLAEVVDPLESTVARLDWIVNRFPGAKRS